MGRTAFAYQNFPGKITNNPGKFRRTGTAPKFCQQNTALGSLSVLLVFSVLKTVVLQKLFDAECSYTRCNVCNSSRVPQLVTMLSTTRSTTRSTCIDTASLHFLAQPCSFFFPRFIHAVAYRWIIRWLCGYMGWENTRPLPAYIYHNIRSRYQTLQSRGYRNALPEQISFCG